MDTRRRITMLAIVAALLAMSYTVGLLINREPPLPVVVAKFSKSEVDRIQAGSVLLRRVEKEGWQVQINGGWYPANVSTVDGLLSTLSGLTAARVASRSRSDWTTFQVDARDAVAIGLSTTKGNHVELYVGKNSSSGGVYVRSAAGPAVYEVFGNLSDYVSAGTSYWSDLRILPRSLSIGSLQTIAISAHGFSVGGEVVNESYLLVASVVAGKSSWVTKGGSNERLDQQKVLSLEGEIVNMVGDRFVTSTTLGSAGLTNPTAVITLSDQQGGRWTLLVGKRRGSEFYVKRADRPYVYLVNQWTLHRAIPPVSGLALSTPKGP